ncbi:DNA-directed RNA polymerase III complex subunit Rpc2 [Gurleya vavrai]
MHNYNSLVTSYITEKGLVRQHLASFNYFIQTDIRNIIFANQIVDSDIDPTFYLKYTDVRVGKPTIEENMISYNIYPHECRLRDLTYASFIFVDIEYVRNKNVIVKKNVCIGKIPVMLRSSICHLTNSNYEIRSKESSENFFKKMNECPLDTGGYFIVKGVERVILIQEQLSKNRILLEDDNELQASVISSTHDKKSKTFVIYKKGALYLKNNSFSEDIPVVIAIKALGLVCDKEIVCYVGNEEEVIDLFSLSLEESFRNNVFTEEQALNYISDFIKVRYGNTKIEEARTVMTEVILPNVICEGLNFRTKGIYISFMARRILLAQLNKKNNENVALSDIDDKDFVGNKRFELAGQLLSIMFEDLFKKYNTELKKSIDKVLVKQSRAQEFDAVTFLNLQVNIITSAFVRAISTGNWTVKRFRMEKKGVTQVLSRLSYISALGMMSRINSQFEKTRKVSGPRALQTSQWGMLCPSDTPEGESCGLVKNLALLAEITTDSDYEKTRENLIKLGAIDIDIIDDLYKNSYVLFLNGMIIGIVNNPEIFTNNFRELRRKGLIEKFVSIYRIESQKTINVSCDGGRIVRPLIIVKNKKVLVDEKDLNYITEKYKNMEDLIFEGKIEYLDVNESGDSLIAMKSIDIKEETTHLEIAPFTILGTVAGLIPFPHHNQSPRNTYQCAMGKQAMGFIGYNQYKRFDTLLYILTYSQKPMIKSKTIELINFEKLPAGQNAIIAVMSFTGYDIEDALILNKASVDRGFGRCEVYKNYTSTLKRYADGSYDRIVRSFNDKESNKEVIDKNHKNLNKEDQKNFESKEIEKDYEFKEKNMESKEIEKNKEFNEKQKSIESTEIESKEINIESKEKNLKSTDLLNTENLKHKEDTEKIISKSTKTENNAKSFNDIRHSLLDFDGVAGPGQIISDGQVFVNQQSPTGIANEYKFSGQVYKNRQPSIIDKVIFTRSGDDNFMIKTLIRQTRIPEIGDKFSSRHGQKGVVGLIVPQEDMPFSERGITPDVIMNPHGFPSRMTVGKIIELISGKAALLTGEQREGTAFCDAKIEEIERIMEENGYSRSGKDIFYSGTTGRILKGYIFTGPVYYQKLKHMVTDKMHARARGPRAMLTRQPTEGRSRDGGLRLGEMERDCLIGYGASSLLIERLLISSDAFTSYVCKECGIISYKGMCMMCKKTCTVPVRIPYACKLLFQELMSMNILPKLILK